MVKHWGLNCGELRVLPQSIGFQAMSDYMVVIWIGGGHFEALILSHFSSEIQCWCWCQKPTFISLVKLKQADLLLLPPSSSKEEPRWRIKTNRPAEPHGHTRRHSVPAKPEHENHGLAKMCHQCLAVHVQSFSQRWFEWTCDCQDGDRILICNGMRKRLPYNLNSYSILKLF